MHLLAMAVLFWSIMTRASMIFGYILLYCINKFQPFLTNKYPDNFTG